MALGSAYGKMGTRYGGIQHHFIRRIRHPMTLVFYEHESMQHTWILMYEQSLIASFSMMGSGVTG